ncbi:MAG TPA: DUF4157 domain-containing protein [Pyrinomonadaceae bacterium]|nr:DUF4157 domain-containing protein [Pyrinomonadaceae bacterium]
MALKNKIHDVDRVAVVQRKPKRAARTELDHEQVSRPDGTLERVVIKPPAAFRPADILALQRIVGNRAVQRMLSSQPHALSPPSARSNAIQLQPEEEEEPLQGAFEAAPRTDKTLTENRTGLPDGLKAGIETLSGLSLDDVKVHRNSFRPSQVQALAYTQGVDIHLAPGQEKHLPHEAWHVVQQKQGRVKATLQAGGVPINDDRDLEKEADAMGRLAAQGQRAVAGTLHDTPAASAHVIQGLFPTSIMQQVVTGQPVTGINLSTKTQENLSGVFVMETNNQTGCVIRNYITGQTYQVDWTQINDQSLWEDVPQTHGQPYFIPQIAPLTVAPEITNRKGAKKGAEPVGKNRPAKRKPKDQTSLERETFSAVKRAKATTEQQPFFSPGAESTGYERLTLLDERESLSATETVVESSLVGRPDTEQAITYCSYCLNWFTPPQLDSDHGITWKIIGQWLLGIADRMNTEGQGFVRAVTLQFQSVGLDIKDFFREISKKWEPTEHGAELMFNNVKNLALSCKTCNQLERNDEEFMDFMKRNLHFGEPFLKWLDKQGVKFEGKEVVSKGQYAGELVNLWIQLTPYVQQAIEHYRRIKLRSVAETERVKRMTQATISGKTKTAKGAEEKQGMHYLLFDLVEEVYESEGEQEADELLKQIPRVIKETKELVQKGVSVQPMQNLEKISLLEEDVNMLQDELEDEQLLHLETRDELKQLETSLQKSREETAQERERANLAEQRLLAEQQKNLDLQKQLQELQRQLFDLQNPKKTPW